MSRNNLIAIGVILLGLFWPDIKQRLPWPALPAPAPGPAVVVPDAQAQQIVAPVAAAAKANPNARKYAAYWADMAQLVRLKPGVFATTGDFQRFHATSSKLFLDLEDGQGAGLAAATEKAIFDLLGAENAKLDDAKAVRCFEALQWAHSQ